MTQEIVQGVPHAGATEQWSVLPDADEYHVSDLGRVAVIATGRMLWQLLDTTGYCTVRVMTTSGRRVRLVHLLVADAFVTNPHGHTEVRHLDGVLKHNQADNLAWGTAMDRENDALRAGWFERIAAADDLGPGAHGLLEPWERLSLVVLEPGEYRPSLSDPWPIAS